MEPHRIPISPRGALVVALTEYKGEVRLDLRVWYLDDAGGWCPSRRGVHVRAEQGPALVAAIVAELGREVPD